MKDSYFWYPHNSPNRNPILMLNREGISRTNKPMETKMAAVVAKMAAVVAKMAAVVAKMAAVVAKMAAVVAKMAEAAARAECNKRRCMSKEVTNFLDFR
jgi:CRISPR/Cas system-associated endonuclease Cas3-HD